MADLRCAKCEAAVDVLDQCDECMGEPRPPGGRGRKPGDPCKYGHERVWSENSKRWRCHECSNHASRMRQARERGRK